MTAETMTAIPELSLKQKKRAYTKRSPKWRKLSSKRPAAEKPKRSRPRRVGSLADQVKLRILIYRKQARALEARARKLDQLVKLLIEA
jgi:hypothetical protein